MHLLAQMDRVCAVFCSHELYKLEKFHCLLVAHRAAPFHLLPVLLQGLCYVVVYDDAILGKCGGFGSRYPLTC